MGDGERSLRFELLGSLRAFRNGEEVALGWPRQQAVLAALLIRAGQVVSRDELVDAVWGMDPPATAANVVHAYVAKLRKILEPDRVHRAPAQVLTSSGRGYVLHVAPGQLDLKIAEQHLLAARRARESNEPSECVTALDAALALWHGLPLTGVPGPFAEIQRARLTEMRMAALEDRAEVLLDSGSRAGLIGELATLAAEHPLRERLAGLLMLALYRDGRPAEALACYQRTRRLLVDELGVEPGPYLRRLHQDILQNRDSGSDGRPKPPEPQNQQKLQKPQTPSKPNNPPKTSEHPIPLETKPPVPRQLPAHTPYFVGRATELDRLTTLGASSRQPGTVMISVINGSAGIGKTTLAVYWAHRAARRFPDGQLYVNLRGFDPTGTPLDPAEAIRGFLGALNTPPERIPATLDAQAGLCRSLLAGKRMLMVLDNALDEDQVRPLLPGSPGCLVVITSRNMLTGLAAEGADLLSLDILTRPEARQLLARRLGRERIAAEAEAAGELIELCARLPLALTVAAARAATPPYPSLAAIATELRDACSRLDALDAGDAATSVRAVFSCSYSHLDADAARTFRLLAVHPVPEVGLPAAASLVGAPIPHALQALRVLTRAHLVTEHSPGRFTFHDLLRAYATGQANLVDSPADRRLAVHRVLDYYLHTAHAAARVLHPIRDLPALEPHEPGVTPERFADRNKALAWCEAEQTILLAVITMAASHGFDKHAWQIPWILKTFLERRANWHDYATTQYTALAAAQRLGDLAAQAGAHLGIGWACTQLHVYDEARVHFERAFGVYAQVRDLPGQALARRRVGWMLGLQHRWAEATGHAARSLDLYRAAGDLIGQGQALNSLGWYHVRLGDLHRALSYCREALDLQLETGDEYGEADTRDSLGYANHQLGDYAEAITCYRHALDLYRKLFDPCGQAETLDRLGDTHQALADTKAARHAWKQALAVFDQLRHPEADNVRAKLARVVV